MPKGKPNAHEIVMDVRELLRGAGASQYQITEFTNRCFRGDYDNLLKEVGRWVTVI